jgi:hypothetical protein
VAPILQSQGAGRLVAKDRDPGSFDLRLVRGDPLLVQVTITSANDEDAAFRSLTFYLAGRPTRLDAKGQVTAADLWLVQCGPPAGGGEMTRNPLPGLTLDAQAKTCATDQSQVVRAAAKASEAWTDPDDLLRIRWLRDGDA